MKKQSQIRIRLKLAKNIVKLRKKAGMTSEELAKKAGLSRSSLNYIERGVSDPRLSSLVGIAGALGKTLNEILG
jgi:transcriptional regulator with XRE-family HTH domain